MQIFFFKPNRERCPRCASPGRKTALQWRQQPRPPCPFPRPLAEPCPEALSLVGDGTAAWGSLLCRLLPTSGVLLGPLPPAAALLGALWFGAKDQLGAAETGKAPCPARLPSVTDGRGSRMSLPTACWGREWRTRPFRQARGPVQTN